MFHFGISARQYLKMSAISRSDGFGGKMYVPRAMYSLSTSFWIVPVSCDGRYALFLARPAGTSAAAARPAR